MLACAPRTDPYLSTHACFQSQVTLSSWRWVAWLGMRRPTRCSKSCWTLSFRTGMEDTSHQINTRPTSTQITSRCGGLFAVLLYVSWVLWCFFFCSQDTFLSLQGGDDLDSNYVLSSRVRTGRSIRGFCLPPHCSRAERRAVENLSVEGMMLRSTWKTPACNIYLFMWLPLVEMIVIICCTKMHIQKHWRGGLLGEDKE